MLRSVMAMSSSRTRRSNQACATSPTSDDMTARGAILGREQIVARGLGGAAQPAEEVDLPLESDAQAVDRAQPGLVGVDPRARLAVEPARQRRAEVGLGGVGARAGLGDPGDGLAQVEVLGDRGLDERRESGS